MPHNIKFKSPNACITISYNKFYYEQIIKEKIKIYSHLLVI